MTESKMRYIDSLSYEELLEKVNMAPPLDPWLSGATGEYMRERLFELMPGGRGGSEVSEKVADK